MGFKVEITLPLTQHDGTSNCDQIVEIEQAIAKQFGGYSCQEVSGGWYDQETRQFYIDHSVLVWTYVPSQEQVDAIIEQVPAWAEALQQIELLVTVSPLDVYFVQGTRVQARLQAA
jgi:hypothetical protein